MQVIDFGSDGAITDITISERNKIVTCIVTTWIDHNYLTFYGIIDFTKTFIAAGEAGIIIFTLIGFLYGLCIYLIFHKLPNVLFVGYDLDLKPNIIQILKLATPVIFDR